MIDQTLALLVAHPGHELRLHGWLQQNHPVLFVITDGSGATGESRLESSRRIAKDNGCSVGSIFGRVTDVDLYRALLAGDIATCAALVEELADALIEHDVQTLIADSIEAYNPSHDLCRHMADLAVALAASRGHAIRNLDYDVTAARPIALAEETLVLDEAMFARKMRAAGDYGELRDEVRSLVSRGIDALRIESLFAPQYPHIHKPYYEVRGEEQVRAGRYSVVLRYREHFLPFVERLARAVMPRAVHA